MSSTQPPPIRVPLSLQAQREEKTYFVAQKDAIYQLWVKMQQLLAATGTTISIKSYSAVSADYTISGS